GTDRNRRFFEESDTEARLSVAGHADADSMGGQIFRVIQQPARLRLLGCEIVRPAQIKHAQLFEIFCGTSTSWCSRSLCRFLRPCWRFFLCGLCSLFSKDEEHGSH